MPAHPAIARHVSRVLALANLAALALKLGWATNHFDGIPVAPNLEAFAAASLDALNTFDQTYLETTADGDSHRFRDCPRWLSASPAPRLRPNDEQTMGESIAAGADGIETDRPRVALALATAQGVR